MFLSAGARFFPDCSYYCTVGASKIIAEESMSSSSAESSDEEVETLVEDPSMTGPVKPRSESGDSGPSNHGSRKSEGAVAAAE